MCDDGSQGGMICRNVRRWLAMCDDLSQSAMMVRNVR